MKNIFCLLLLCYGQLHAQRDSTLTLQACQQQAREHFPYLQQQQIIESITALQLKNTRNSYLPQLELNAQATYQSEVTRIPIELPNFTFGLIPKDQYRATIDVKQLIYDGGTNKQTQKVQQAQQLVEQQKLELNQLQVKQQVTQTYFNALLWSEHIQASEQLVAEMKQRIEKMSVGVQNGAILESNVDLLKAELLKSEQQLFEANTGKSTAIKILRLLTGMEISEGVRLEKPSPQVSEDLVVNNRPEMRLFSLQTEALQVQDKLTATRNMPKLSAFFQGGVGRPGLNMLDNEFKMFYFTGLRLNWNFWNWHAQRNDRQVIALQEKNVQKQTETFELTTRSQLLQQQAEINNYAAAIQRDASIVSLRTKVKNVSANQLDNGAITVHDYLTDLYNETQAKIQYKTHEIQWIYAQINYQITKGN
ncbi:outer membrane protein TolC [Chitinophaga skermanii]|uniref:Outer membrane protein TolC n=1 Tax=Chitinophaga skermanii TaxID=331697 RepID=A0A327QY61_9BACT|nr:TolC family protein [Chitinophaga skermanii]RAJ08915.1 outer membrane protein TolC [Chitinophaga skermanii]